MVYTIFPSTIWRSVSLFLIWPIWYFVFNLPFSFSGAKNISESVSNVFEGKLLNALLEILDSINEVHSAGGLQWLSVLLYKVAQPEYVPILISRCVTLLTNIANELQRRTNPYHLLLRSRYGLYGTPLEPELFDVEPPPPTKSSSTTVTYASVVTGENGAQNVTTSQKQAKTKTKIYFI